MELIIAAIAPAALLLIVFYKLDRYDPEPIKLLVKLYVLGMISVIPIIIVERILQAFNIFRFYGSDLMNLYEALVVAGFSEELFKWGIVLLIAFRHKAYDEYLDGIIYCVYVSLGFATVENILYVIEGSYSVAVMRAILAVPAHMLFGVSMGYYLSIAKFSPKKIIRSRYFAYSLIIPILLHGAYDYILMSQYRFLLFFFIPYVVWMWGFNLRKLKVYHQNSRFNHLSNEEV